jgi:hypothetical protein
MNIQGTNIRRRFEPDDNTLTSVCGACRAFTEIELFSLVVVDGSAVVEPLYAFSRWRDHSLTEIMGTLDQPVIPVIQYSLQVLDCLIAPNVNRSSISVSLD